jgi:DNA-binding NarL/FixJ family response regulator
MERIMQSAVSPALDLTTCVVANSRLASEYILQWLASDPGLGPTSLDQFVDHPAPSAQTVFVFDGASLRLPLGESVRRLRHRFEDAKYLLIDIARTRQELSRLLSMGIQGFVEDREVAVLPKAVRALHVGDLWMPAGALQEYALRTAAKRHKYDMLETITPREGQILELVQQRYSNKEIAEMLQIRESTTKFHLTNIFGKLQVLNRRELQNREGHGAWERI